MTKFKGVALSVIVVPLIVEITEPGPNASTPSASVAEDLIVIDPPEIVAWPPAVARTPSLWTPDVMMASLVNMPVAGAPLAPVPAIQTAVAEAPDTSTLPVVVIDVPVAESDEPKKEATPTEPSFVVVTLPPVRTTLAPEALRTPGALSPVVRIAAPVRAIVDAAPEAAPEAKTAIELSPLVVTVLTSDAVIAPPAVA